jgi:ATP-binding cassette subfamily C (CFTR/MRP) protein 1
LVGIWLQKATDDNSISLGLFIGIFALSAAVGIGAITMMIYQILIVIAPLSAIRLHGVLVETTFRAPMSFFESTDTSILLNRFSQDMSTFLILVLLLRQAILT